MLGQLLSASVLNQHKDISLGARLLRILQTHQRAHSSSSGGTGEDAVPGKQDSAQPASYTPGSSGCATGNPEERGGSSPASPHDLHWCQGVFASAQLLQPGAFLGLPQPSPLPNLTGGSPAGKGIPEPPSTKSAGKHKALGLVSGEIWGQGEKRLQDFNPCSSEFSFQNIF